MTCLTCKAKIRRDNLGTTMDNSLLGNALLENVFFERTPGIHKRKLRVFKIRQTLEMEGSYVFRQMIYLHSKCQTKIPTKQKKIIIIIKRRTHVSMLKILMSYLRRVRWCNLCRLQCLETFFLLRIWEARRTVTKFSEVPGMSWVLDN